MNHPSISVIVHTLNEAANIRTCLECLKWADEIVVIDMYSEDQTVTIAREFTDKIFMHERMRYVEPARQFGLQQATHEWVLVVDADEVVPVELRDFLLKVAQEGRYDAVWIPRRNYLFGNCLKQAGWGAVQDRQLRFFKKAQMNYSDRIHSGAQLSPEARICEISDENCSFIHFNYTSVEQFISRLNRYTTIEAENDCDSHKEFSKGRVCRQVLREFKNRFFREKGYKDGFQGFGLAVLMSAYKASIGLKRYYIEKYGTKDVETRIQQQYATIAQSEIAKYATSSAKEGHS